MAVFTASQHSPSDAFKMNQLCKVCGEPAAGFHFGAFTCEGCKSFFGRSYNNLSVISECKNGGQCVINKKNRTSCKACRLRKCLLVGMSKSGSRYGRRSNWFKLHCLMQEQNPSAPAGSADPLHMRTRGLHSSPQAMISGLKGAIPCSSMSSNESKDDAEDYKTSTSPSISSPGSQHSDSSVDLTETKSPSLTLNPFALKLAHPKLCDGFPSMAFLPPHLQAAAGFFSAGFPQPRFLFPAMTAFALSGSPPGGLPATAVRSSRKFNIDSMIPLSKSSPELPLIAQEAEQDTPIDLSVKRPFKRLRPDEDFPSDESDMESTDPAEDDADETQDPDEENDSSERGLESKDPLDLTRK